MKEEYEMTYTSKEIDPVKWNGASSADLLSEMRLAEMVLKEQEMSKLKSFLVNLGMEKEDIDRIEYDCVIIFPDIPNKEEMKSKLPWWLEKRIEFCIYQKENAIVINRSSQECKPQFNMDMYRKHAGVAWNPPPMFKWDIQP